MAQAGGTAGMVKARLRAAVRSLRRAAALASPAAGEGLAAAFARLPPALASQGAPPSGVAGYVPLEGEIDPGPLLRALAQRGAVILLPRIEEGTRRLTFRRCDPSHGLEQGPFGTRMPPAAAPACRPGLVLVPLLAFDRALTRLGHGGGYYDATLASLRAEGPVLALGLAFAAQEIHNVPREPHDVPLDGVLTERGPVLA